MGTYLVRNGRKDDKIPVSFFASHNYFLSDSSKNYDFETQLVVKLLHGEPKSG